MIKELKILKKAQKQEEVINPVNQTITELVNRDNSEVSTEEAYDQEITTKTLLTQVEMLI